MFADPMHFARCAAGATAHAERPDYLPDRAVEAFLEFVAN
jgi:hypothetical protein